MLKPQANATREMFNCDGFWAFAADPDNDGESHGWHQAPPTQHHLAVPGSWHEQIHALRFYFGVGWYHRRVHLPRSFQADGRRVFLHGGGVVQDATVWINGQQVGHHVGGHLPFEFDITDALPAGGAEVLVVIRVDHRLREDMLPAGNARRDEDRLGFGKTAPDVPYDFFPYGGLHRPVTISSRDACHLDRLRVTTDFDGADGLVQVAATASADAAERIRCTCGEASAEADLDGTRATAELRIPDVTPWRLGVGHLYDVQVELLRGETVIDTYRLPVGVRTVRIDGDQLLINGEPVSLTGFGKHEDSDFAGRGLHPPQLIKDFELLDWIGANSFRTSHYPYSEEWYEEADRRGIAIIGETPFVSLADRLYTDELSDHAADVIARMIDRDGNHPSVIAWSVANEPFHAGSERGLPFFKRMIDTAHAEDPTRPVTYVAHLDPVEFENGPAQYVDFLGLNKYYGWYIGHGRNDEGTTQAFVDCLQSFYDAYKKPILLGEFGADTIAGFGDVPEQAFTEGFQAELVVRQARAATALPFVIGVHLWNFADFATGQQLNRIHGNKKGIFTRDRKPKLAAYALRQLWTGIGFGETDIGPASAPITDLMR